MQNKLLILIVAIGFILRVFFVDQFPVSLNWDEISHGYNAYSILKTGSDEWGQTLPFANFRAYGDYPLAFNLYITMPFVAILGLNELAIRLPHVLLGTLTILAVYYLTFGITKKKNLALLAAFLSAIDPWFLFPSRFVLQSNLSVFFLIAGIAAFVNRKKSKWMLPFSVLLLGLTLYSYHTTRILTPLIVSSLATIYWKELKKYFSKKTLQSILPIILLVLFFVPLPFILLNPESRARSNEVFVIDSAAIAKIEEQRNNSTLSPLMTKVLYNRPVYLAEKFVSNYIGYFSPQYLFINGGTQYQFSVPGFGLLNPVNILFFYIGLGIIIFKSRKNKDFRMLLFWLILAPIPAGITLERYAVLRSSAMLPIPQIASALGFFAVLKYLKYSLSKIFIAGYLFILVIFFAIYLRSYFGEYATGYSWAWQYGYKQAVNYVQKSYNKYDQIIVTKKYGEPHEFFLFFMKYDPTKYKKDPNLIRFYQSKWYWVDRFDKFWFVNDWQVVLNPPWMSSIQQKFITESKHEVNCEDQKCLLITSPDNAPPGWSKIDQINFFDNSPAFEIYENN